MGNAVGVRRKEYNTCSLNADTQLTAISYVNNDEQWNSRALLLQSVSYKAPPNSKLVHMDIQDGLLSCLYIYNDTGNYRLVLYDITVKLCFMDYLSGETVVKTDLQVKFETSFPIHTDISASCVDYYGATSLSFERDYIMPYKDCIYLRDKYREQIEKALFVYLSNSSGFTQYSFTEFKSKYTWGVSEGQVAAWLRVSDKQDLCIRICVHRNIHYDIVIAKGTVVECKSNSTWDLSFYGAVHKRIPLNSLFSM